MKYISTTHRKGSIVIFALIMMSIIVVTALGMLNTSIVGRQSSSVTSKSTNAFQNADGGIEVFLQELYHNMSVWSDLNAVASALGGSCNDGRISSGGDSQFEIVTYKKVVTEVVPPAPAVEVTDCDTTTIGDIGQLKVIGEYNGAARAIQVTLRDSLARGLVAYWDFQDSAENKIFLGHSGSTMAKDRSGGHKLALCQTDDSDNAEPFGICPEGADSNVWMGYDSVWTSGAVDDSETLEGGSSIYAGSQSQGINFNGVSHYLAMNTTDHRQENYVDDDSALDFTDALSISVWVRRASSHEQILVAKHDGSNDGYKLSLKGNKVVFTLENASSRSVQTSSINGGWHHVVASWEQGFDNGEMRVYLDGVLQSTTHFGLGLDASGEPLFVGGFYNKGTNSFEKGFGGALDDLRIYNRALSDSEVVQLCEMKKDAVSVSCS